MTSPPARTLTGALLGPETLQRSGDLNGALRGYLKAAAAFPAEPEPRFRAALLYAATGSQAAAEPLLREAIALSAQPQYFLALGDVLQQSGQQEEAIGAWRRAAELHPGLVAAWSRLGVALSDAGRLEEAAAAFRSAATLSPQSASAWWNVGSTLLGLGADHQAQPALEQASRLAPDDPRVWEALGGVFLRVGALIRARDAFARASQLAPDRAGPWLGLANCDTHFGRTEQVMDHLARAEARAKVDAAQVGSQRLIAMQYSLCHGPEAVFKAHLDWASRYAPVRPTLPVFANTRNPNRRLRLGYLSPRFHQSSVSPLIVPVLESHDPEAVEVFCYASQSIEDQVTSRIRAACAGWRSILRRTDEEVADQIRADEIDILIDLAGHTPGHRLTVLAQRPAPVQVTWLDYFNTTGIDAVDVIISDPVHSPEVDRQQFVERLVRMPALRYCWEPPASAPDIAVEALAQTRAPVFGSFNRLAKLSQPTLDAWCELLLNLPDSRLVLKNSALQGEAEREEVASWFTRRGIDRGRLSLRGSSSYEAMLAEYREVDVALDTFPYNGGLTTLDALWMGRPVVTLQGESMIGRQSQAILSAIGLPDLCARDVAGYVTVAMGLVKDRLALARLSAGLRERLRRSPIMDTKGFTRMLEAQLREQWRRWCEADT